MEGQSSDSFERIDFQLKCDRENHGEQPVQFVNFSQQSKLKSRFLCQNCIIDLFQNKEKSSVEQLVSLDSILENKDNSIFNWPPLPKNSNINEEILNQVKNFKGLQEKYDLTIEDIKAFYQKLREKMCEKIDNLEKNTIIQFQNLISAKKSIIPKIQKELNSNFDLEKLRNLLKENENSIENLNKSLLKFINSANQKVKNNKILYMQSKKLIDSNYIDLEKIVIQLQKFEEKIAFYKIMKKNLTFLEVGNMMQKPVFPFDMDLIKQDPENCVRGNFSCQLRMKSNNQLRRKFTAFYSQLIDFYQDVKVKLTFKSKSKFMEPGCRISVGVIKKGFEAGIRHGQYENNNNNQNLSNNDDNNSNNNENNNNVQGVNSNLFSQNPLNNLFSGQQQQQQLQEQAANSFANRGGGIFEQPQERQEVEERSIDNRNMQQEAVRLFSNNNNANSVGIFDRQPQLFHEVEQQEQEEEQKEEEGNNRNTNLEYEKQWMEGLKNYRIDLNQKNNEQEYSQTGFRFNEVFDKEVSVWLEINIEKNLFTVYNENRIFEIRYLKEFGQSLKWRFYVLMENLHQDVELEFYSAY